MPSLLEIASRKVVSFLGRLEQVGVIRSESYSDSSREERAALIGRVLDAANTVIMIAGAVYVSNIIANNLVSSMSQTMSASQVSAKQNQLALKLGRPDILTMEFDSYECAIMEDVICPQDIDVLFQDIGGMAAQLENIADNIITPLQLAKIYEDFRSIAPMPTGALMYGPPGTGKTLCARAIAKEAGATFLSLKFSTLQSKWFGESNKRITALFSLARKLAPTIIFLDEIDTLLGNRDSECTGHNVVLGHMLAEWDGLAGNGEPLLILGTTNRPMDLDKAFLRRMPLMIKTFLPTEHERLDILCKMLRHDDLDESVDLKEVAKRTENYTGSDIRELIRLATLTRAKEFSVAVKVAQKKEELARAAIEQAGIVIPKSDDAAGSLSSVKKKAKESGLRPLNMLDFERALLKSRSTKSNQAFDYEEEMLLESHKAKKEVYDRVAAALAELVPQAPKKADKSDLPPTDLSVE